MSTLIEKLVIGLGLDTEELNRDFAKAQEDTIAFTKEISDSVGKAFGKNDRGDFFFKSRKDAQDFRYAIDEAHKPFTGMVKAAEHLHNGLSVVEKGLGVAKNAAIGLLNTFNTIGEVIDGFVVSNAAAWLAKFLFSVKEMKQEVKELNELGKELNVNVEDISAWSSAIETNGGSAKAFQRTLTSLTREITNLSVTGRSRTKPVLEMLGIDTSNMSGKPVFALIDEITKAVEGMDKKESRNILKKLGFDAEAIELIQSGSKNIEELIKQQKEWGIYTQKDTEAIDKLDKSLKIVTHVLKTTFIPIFSRILGVMSKVAERVSKVAIWTRKNLDSIKKAALVLAAVFSGQLYKAILELGVMLMKNPFALFIIGLTTLLLLLEDLYTYAEGGESAFEGLWEKLGTPQQVMEGFEKVGKFFDSLGELVESGVLIFTVLWAILSKVLLALAAFAGFPATVAVAIAAALAFVITYYKEINKYGREAVKKIKKWFSSLGDTIKGIFGIGGSANQAFDELLQSIENAFQSAKESIKKNILAAIEFVKEKIMGLFGDLPEKISSTWERVKKGFTDTFSDVEKEAKDTALEIGKSFEELPEDMDLEDVHQSADFEFNVGQVESPFGQLSEEASSLWDRIKDGASNALTSISDKAKEFSDTAKESTSNAWNFIIDDLSTVSSKVNDIINDIRSLALEAWNSVVDTIWSTADTISSIFENIKSFISEAWDYVVSELGTSSDNINAIFDTIKAFVIEAWNVIEAEFKSAFERITTLWNGLISAFQSGCSAIAGFLSNAANAARRAWESFINWLEQKWNWLKDLLPSFEKIAGALPRVDVAPQMAVAGASNTVSNSVTTDNSVHNTTINTHTAQATNAAMEKAGFVSMSNSGVRRR